MPKKRRNINYRQSHSARSATDSARAFGRIQRNNGLFKLFKSRVKS